MRTTMSHPHQGVTYPTAQRVTAHVALALGVKEETAHQYLYSRENKLNAKVAMMITALIQSGDRAALAHFLAPIEAAVRGIPAPAESVKLSEQAQVADGDEDSAGVRYYRSPCLETARAYVLAIDTQNAIGLEERNAIAKHWSLA
jgi:hypothetical protein